MELGNCMLRHRGALTSSVFKANITPAEAVVLRAIHGDGAVIELEVIGKARNFDEDGRDIGPRSDADELQRLKGNDCLGYGVTEGNVKLIADQFPGFSPKLPRTFAEAGFDAARSGSARVADKAPSKLDDVME